MLPSDTRTASIRTRKGDGVADLPTPEVSETGSDPGERKSANPIWVGLLLAAVALVLLLFLSQCVHARLANEPATVSVTEKSVTILYPPTAAAPSTTTTPVPLPGTSQGQPTVPTVVGMVQSSGSSMVTANGYRVSYNYVSSSLPSGRILGQSPAGGTSLAAGRTVTLTVSEGSSSASRLTVPNVVGMTKSDAENTIRAAGFDPLAVQRPALSSVPVGKAAQQWPQAGSSELVGSQVSFIYGAQP